jgi:hypothetical protein
VTMAAETKRDRARPGAYRVWRDPALWLGLVQAALLLSFLAYFGWQLARAAG